MAMPSCADQVHGSCDTPRRGAASMQIAPTPARTPAGAAFRWRRVPPYAGLARVYDETLGNAALSAIIDCFRRSCRRHGVTPRLLADVGCGTGSFLKYLSQFPIRLIGVDRSNDILRIAQARLKGVPVQLLRQDIRGLHLPQRADCITCTFDTVNYFLSNKDLLEAFRSLAKNLIDGGYLLFDYIPALEAASPARQPVHQVFRVGRTRAWWRVALDPKGRGSRIDVYLQRPLADGTVDRTREAHVQRWYRPSEIKALLCKAGFRQLESRPVEPESEDQWLHVVARKRQTE